jgi:hypothetical protein
MKHIIIILTILMSLFAVSCIKEPVACTEEAKLCPDGSAVGRIPPNCEFAQCPSEGKKVVIQCTAEQKKADICTKEFMPVCGWFNETIKCFKYPCAQTFSNKCMACISDNVDEYTEGECPKDTDTVK